MPSKIVKILAGQAESPASPAHTLTCANIDTQRFRSPLRIGVPLPFLVSRTAPGRFARMADLVRQYAERTDPLNGRLHLAKVTSCSHEELQPHMNGWSTYGPYRQ